MSNLNIREIHNALLAMPIAKVVGAYNALSGDNSAVSKAAAIDWLQKQVVSNQFSMSQVQNAAHGVVQAAPVTKAPSQAQTRQVNDLAQSLRNAEVLLNARVDDTHKRLDKVDSTMCDTINRLNLINDTVSHNTNGITNLDGKITDLIKDLKGLGQKIGKFQIDEAQVNAAVAQVIDGAFAPFRKAVEDAGAQAIVADMTSVRVIDRRPALEVFGVEVNDVKGNPLMVDIWNHPAAPAIDPLFIWTPAILEDLLGVQETGENLWFGGDRGTGKSETARQFAARTGRNFARVNYHKHSSADEFIGAVGLENGATVYKPGAFLQAFLTPSTVILNDEISNAPEGELATLNPLLEPNCAVIYGGAVRRRAPGVMIFAADNTLGCGDESGRYAGTRTMNSALIDRFARVLHFQYLPLAEEIKAVCNHTNCTPALAEHVLTAVRVAREKVTEGEIIDAPSIRSVVAFIRALKVKQPAQAWSSCIVARQPSESRTALDAIFKTYIDQSLINANI